MSIEELRSITNNLLPLEDLIQERRNKMVQWATDGGTCIGFSLWDEGGVSVVRSFLSKDTHFKPHIHPGCTETMVIYKGRMKIRYNGDERILEPGGSIALGKDRPHESWALEDTWLIGITVPASEGYPRERKYMD